MRKSNEEMKNLILGGLSAIESTHTYAFAIRENHMLKACIVENADDILHMVTYCERRAESKGGYWGVRMINSRESFNIIKAYAREVIDLCSIDYFESVYAEQKYGKGNRGNCFEHILAEAIGAEMNTAQNAKLIDCGDIRVNGEEIQCKLYNATITDERTLANLTAEYNKRIKA